MFCSHASNIVYLPWKSDTLCLYTLSIHDIQSCSSVVIITTVEYNNLFSRRNERCDQVNYAGSPASCQLRSVSGRWEECCRRKSHGTSVHRNMLFRDTIVTRCATYALWEMWPRKSTSLSYTLKWSNKKVNPFAGLLLFDSFIWGHFLSNQNDQ